MANSIGIRFKPAGKVYSFDPAGIELNLNDCVVVETIRGVELGYIATAVREMGDSETGEALKPILRKAEAEDIEQARELEEKAGKAFSECAKLISELQLPMKLLSAEYNLDGSRLTFLFSAEERVDFRELLRRLTKQFKSRVELRQIGSRDEAKLIGGFGRCGRPLCCNNFIKEFEPVSIKMAKEQDLPLNPMKISGICGRLMCCLGYENAFYHCMKMKFPKVGKQVNTPMGRARVLMCNPLKESVLVELESQATVEVPVDDVSLAPLKESGEKKQ